MVRRRGEEEVVAESEAPERLIPRTLNECQELQSVHLRTVKELVKCRSGHHGPQRFLKVWCECLRPIFLVRERELAVERVVRFVATFTAYRDEEHANDCDDFVEEFLKHLLQLAEARDRTVRYRTCQLISEVMTRLGEDVEVSDDVWVALISSMQQRMQDKVPFVRVFAASALARLVTGGGSGIEDDPILLTYQEALENDRSADVRRMVVMSMPALDSTIHQLVEHTADVSDSVRKAVYSVLGSKFPIQMLSIMQRAKVLGRGLADRVPAVQTECVHLLETWLTKDCEGDGVALLRYLDVQTHEKVGEVVLLKALKEGMIKMKEGDSLRQFFQSPDVHTGQCNLENGESGVKQLLNAEQALYFRVLCSTLDSEAQVKRSEAASTGGAQATVYAAVAADNVEALEMILPPTVAAYVGLVNAHLCAGPQHRFAARQLLLLANLLDFSDSANHKAAGTLVHSLLQEESSERGIASETDPDVVIGDALSLGRDKEWADAVARLAVQVHAEQGEYEKVTTDAIVVLGQPCREGGAQVSQWLHCLAVTSLLLEHLKSIQWLSGCAIGAQEIVDALLLVAAKHFHPEVQKAGVRCLGLFQLLASKPSLSVVTQLRRSLFSSFETVQIMAVKATFDVLLWCGAASLDRVPPNHPVSVIGDDEMVTRKPLMELLMNLLESAPIEEKPDELVESETVGGLVAEGFAKVLLQSKAFKDVQTIEDILFAQLICLYFNGDMNNSPRLQQCLSVFFINYSVLSADNKKCIARAFIPVMRSAWPGIYGNEGGTSSIVAAKKNRATQLSKFMLELLENQLEGALNENGPLLSGETPDVGQGRLAINIAVEVKRISSKANLAAKSYQLAMARIAPSLKFHASQQEEIKCMRFLLGPMMDAVARDKLLVRELKAMELQLKALDMTPQECLSEEQLQVIIDNLKLSYPKPGDDNEEPASGPMASCRRTTTKKGATARATQGAVRQAASQSQCQTKLQAQNHITLSDSATSTEVTTELDTEADSHEGAASGIKSSSQVLATQATCATDSSDGSCVEHEDKHEIRLITPHIRSSQVRGSSANNTIGIQGVQISGPKTRRQSTKAANTASNPTERRQTGRPKSGQSVVLISDESDSDFETLPRKQLPSAAGKGNL
ncbi:unnamed protein product [Sphagnum jensenii]|uniref:Nuclear condensin complex subunit 3 C-terminal domain-containing protein n=1 Tax=Sphagnum jensenii TaxID=128206 RepID=A0ABP1C0N3_9BRYO